MFCKMIRSHKSLPAEFALESFFACMSSEMPLKLIRSSKAFATIWPSTAKWSFSQMPSDMSLNFRKQTRQNRDYLQVWCLPINFLTIWKRAIMFSFRANRHNSLATSLILAIWTLTSNASSYRRLWCSYRFKNWGLIANRNQGRVPDGVGLSPIGKYEAICLKIATCWRSAEVIMFMKMTLTVPQACLARWERGRRCWQNTRAHCLEPCPRAWS